MVGRSTEKPSKTNNMSQINLEQKRKSIETFVKVAAIGVVGFLVAPFIFVAVKGIVGLAIAGIVGLVAVNAAPAVAAHIANWRLKALKAVAAANPIETLENIYAEKQNALIQMRQNIKATYAALEDLKSKIQAHDAKYPDQPSVYADKYAKLMALAKDRGEKFQVAKQKLAAFGQQIEEKRSDWEIAKAMEKVSNLAQAGEDFQSKLMQDTALLTVQNGLNMAFSELEVSLLDNPQQTQVSISAPAATSTKSTATQISEKSSLPDLDLEFAHDNSEELQYAVAKRKK